ncbi:MAG: type IV secretory system conjugative DNA transfer family protein [Patescibacteria group bacterium]|jgi:hypothetical protein
MGQTDVFNQFDQTQKLGDFGQTAAAGGQSLLSQPVVAGVLYFILFIAIVVAGLALLRFLLIALRRRLATFNRVVLQVLLPKESEEQAEKEEAIQKKDIKEVIAEVEGLYAALIGTARPHNWGYWWYAFRRFWTGHHSHLSLEMVAWQDKIKFYLVTPKHLAEYVEKQIHAAYPDATVEKTSDYNIFTPHGAVAGSYLCPSRSQILPLRTYKKMDFDPLESVTSNLSKFEAEDGVAIQLLVRPGKSKWRSQGIGIAKKMHQGETLENALRGQSGWLNFIGWSFGLPYKGLKFLVDNFFVTAPKPGAEKPAGEMSEGDKMRHAPVRILKREEELIQALEEKYAKPCFEANLRLVVSAKTPERTTILLRSVIGSFSQFSSTSINNQLKGPLLWFKSMFINDFICRNFREFKKFIISSEELVSLYHFPLSFNETPNIVWLPSRRAAPPVDLPTEGIILGKSVYRGQEKLVRLQKDDRRRHTYIIGKSGTGKSFLLANMAIQDIQAGEGVCIIDPHGDLVDDVFERVPKERADDVILFDPADIERPMGLNLLEYDPRYPEQKTFVINEMIKIFDKLYDLKQTGGPMFEQYMRNAMLLVMEDPESGSTLMEISKVLVDPDYRRYKISKCQTQVVKDFWVKEAEKAGGEAALANMVPYITSKLTSFISNDFMRPIIGQQHSAINFRDAMDSGKILLVKLSKGRLGDINTNLVGMMMVGKILMAALSRTDMPKEKRRDFYLYIDEFQNFTTDSIAVILSEARKYMLNLIIAHQYIGQLVKHDDTTIKDAVFGNVGTMIAFKIGAEDAEHIAKEFAPIVNQFDLINVERFNAYIKLLINNQASRPFNLQTLILPPGNPELSQKIKELSRLKYGHDRASVEREIIERSRSAEFSLGKVDKEAKI